jgi:hypothetical protein
VPDLLGAWTKLSRGLHEIDLANECAMKQSHPLSGRFSSLPDKSFNERDSFALLRAVRQ